MGRPAKRITRKTHNDGFGQSGQAGFGQKPRPRKGNLKFDPSGGPTFNSWKNMGAKPKYPSSDWNHGGKKRKKK